MAISLGRGGTIHSVDESELDAPSCPKERFDPDDVGEFDDEGDPKGIPPGELFELDDVLELELHGMPTPEFVTEPDADEVPERFDPCGCETWALALETRPPAPWSFWLPWASAENRSNGPTLDCLVESNALAKLPRLPGVPPAV